MATRIPVTCPGSEARALLRDPAESTLTSRRIQKDRRARLVEVVRVVAMVYISR
jgi:hypothetical protein